ncbi:MAG: glycoside hydrolase family 9 protein, partial [Bacteroidetes bacterium]|nr:glycoside hydrolase family 9 protein [Bacteroidota bacterium]
MKVRPVIFLLLLFICYSFKERRQQQNAWIRINQLGYTPKGVKNAVWCSREQLIVTNWQLVDATSQKVVLNGKAGKAFGEYGPFKQTYRLSFSEFTKPGRYYLQAGETKSPEFTIGDDVYKGAADFCLRYMRQQRTGFNPFLKDSCHTHDGYTLYGEKAGLKDSTHINVVGGWHDATDYLQYSMTSANATYHLLMAYRDFPNVFGDEKQANGLDESNGRADVLDEAKWGLDWLLKMHPRDDWMFNQIADDRDHAGFRLPGEDSFYGKGFERPVYFVTGEPQQRQKFMNNTTGTSSVAGKFSSAFALGSSIFFSIDKNYSELLNTKALSAYSFAFKKKGATQTASVKSPYIYAEDNWTDDIELANAYILSKDKIPIHKKVVNQTIMDYANAEPVTPWMGADSAKHYQWYPFINIGHYETAKLLNGKQRDTITGYYKEGILRVWNKAKQNAFYRGVPFIWCSNNLTTSFTTQCYWYRQLTGDKTFEELEQANFDWLFGCNPWGTSFVYGLPSWGDTPVDPHSSLSFLKHYPLDGGLVDGPVYGITYKNQLGLSLNEPDEYAEFQSDYIVYHDDVGDYCTNEPTMDGTASLIYMLAAKEAEAAPSKSPLKGETSKKSLKIKFSHDHGAIIRGDSAEKKIAFV